MSSSEKRAGLIQELTTQFRHVSVNSVMFSEVIATKVGLHSTDNECLDFLLLNGPSTAGQLSKFTGLTTGAVTAMIDRLEKAGYVRREPDKKDRRKVIVVPNGEKIFTDISPHSMPMGTALENVCQEFSDAELEIVSRFISKANHAAVAVISNARKNE